MNHPFRFSCDALTLFGLVSLVVMPVSAAGLMELLDSMQPVREQRLVPQLPPVPRIPGRKN